MPVALCSNCRDEGCGYTAAEIVHGDGTVMWSIYEVWSDLDDHHDLTALYTFDPETYEAALAPTREAQ